MIRKRFTANSFIRKNLLTDLHNSLKDLKWLTIHSDFWLLAKNNKIEWENQYWLWVVDEVNLTRYEIQWKETSFSTNHQQANWRNANTTRAVISVKMELFHEGNIEISLWFALSTLGN